MCKLCKGEALKPFSCSIRNKTLALCAWSVSVKPFQRRRDDRRSAQPHGAPVSGPLRGLRLRSGLGCFDCHVSRRLKLGQMQTELILHASEGCGSEPVTAYVVGSHRGKVLNCGFGRRHRASRATVEGENWIKPPEMGKKNKQTNNMSCGTCRKRYLLPSEVDVEPSLQQLVSYQGNAKLRGWSEDSC